MLIIDDPHRSPSIKSVTSIYMEHAAHLPISPPLGSTLAMTPAPSPTSVCEDQQKHMTFQSPWQQQRARPNLRKSSQSSTVLILDAMPSPPDSDRLDASSPLTHLLSPQQIQHHLRPHQHQRSPSASTPAHPKGIDQLSTESHQPRKRGRPRKHPIAEPKRTSYARSKTGCGTCRRRKKKCDETRPHCLNCEKNNVVCDGYEPKQLWRGGRQQRGRGGSSSSGDGDNADSPSDKVTRLSSPVRALISAELPLLIDGVDGSLDQILLQHFTDQVGPMLSLPDQPNPFLGMIFPMALSHTGLMHSLLYLSASCLMAKEAHTRLELEQRQEHHSTRAMRLLQSDLVAAAASPSAADHTAALRPLADASITQALIFCLQSVCSGDLSGSYRFHLTALQEILTSPQTTITDPTLHSFLLEFFLHHTSLNALTSLTNPFNPHTLTLTQALPLSLFPESNTLIGIHDGLFTFIPQIRILRDTIRARRSHTHSPSWNNASLMTAAFAIHHSLRTWVCPYPPSSPRWAAALLYRQCIGIYLQRTILPSRASPTFHQAVADGLAYLRLLHTQDTASGAGGHGANSVTLLPLFLLGCAAFDPSQRIEIDDAFDTLQRSSPFGNIRPARSIVEQIWELMDSGREEDAWDWEGVMAGCGWDFLVI